MPGSRKKKAAVKDVRPDQDYRKDGADPLADVQLEEFSISPESVAPFETATISWKVRAPEGVALRLDGSPIEPTGTRVVTPTDSKTFRLMALTDAGSRHLGNAALELASDRCVRRASSNIDEFLVGALTDAVLKSDNLYFRLIPTGTGSPFGGVKYVQSKPIVQIQKDRISFRLLLGADVNNFPDPTVDVVGSFGLAVVPILGPSVIVHKTEIVPDHLDVSVDVSFPWYAYLVPGAAIGLPIAASMSEDSGKRDVSDGIREFVRALLNWPSPQPGLIKHSVSIYVDEYDVGTVEIEFCPVQRPSIDPG